MTDEELEGLKEECEGCEYPDESFVSECLALIAALREARGERDHYRFRFEESDADRTRIGTDNIRLRMRLESAAQTAEEYVIDLQQTVARGLVTPEEARAIAACAEQLGTLPAAIRALGQGD